MPRRVYGSIDPDLAAFRERLMREGPPVEDASVVGVAKAREQRRAQARWLAGESPDVAHCGRITIAGRDGPIEALAVRPHDASADAAMLYLHGGGFMFGDLDTHERLAREYAAASGMTVVMPHYRRTPEHPFPAALHDAADVWSWMGGGASGMAARRLVLGGDSAGGNLAFALARMLADTAVRPPDALWLLYPMMSQDHGGRSHALYGDGRFGLSTAALDAYWRHYLGGDPSAAANPLAVPALAGLDGLPPTALFVAECDPLADDGWSLAERLASAGHPHSVDVFAGMTHAFIQYGAFLPAAREAHALIGRRIGEILAG
jgi:acetyl esterase